MNFKEVFQNEHVTRKFTNRKVPEKAIAEIVEQAQQSPSLLNSQPWRAYVLMGDALAEFKKAAIENSDNKVKPNEDFASMLSLDWDTFPSSNMATMGASQSFFFRNKLNLFTEANKNMFNAPAIIFLTIPRKSPAWSVFDLGIFAQSIMLLAVNRGLGIMPAHSMVSYPDLVRKYAGISEDEYVGMAIAVGYIDKNAEINDPVFIPKRVPFNKIYKVSN
ncbi:nitroreductase [Lactobacillus amylovorus]|uniref:nitroreductase n=1 Tax=Lactobacillus amylovorus TaxID=1604 RepID=UPI00232BA47F|nr:nitroreductase [Lactobacillus amylovorus]MDB6231193.1 nitroreductase [Lactobacillus amylovorus]MDB6233061.1 nitroreductase [Lactobacillus amylovorus]MDB6242182.1 nitroreductase [Lactobacillus amylovorus]MDB6244898.1 nitroreductase [Lactobacillus amylovorus]MDB6247921.1 nitroreductase [Lactobacillus amylovorus]